MNGVAGAGKAARVMGEHHTPSQTLRDRTRSLEEYRRAVIVIMADKAFPAATIAEVLGVSSAQVYNCLKRRREGGVEALRASANRGRPPVVDREFKLQLRRVRSQPPRIFGYGKERWTLALLRDHMHQQTGRLLSLEHIRRLLAETGPLSGSNGRPLSPRPNSQPTE